ncbi:hypothetical protein KAI58_02300 [Candidatus Gracilibacteria bacterium]|nr:hypothetical protein [Candidatus Gracilibacteria bacterium]
MMINLFKKLNTLCKQTVLARHVCVEKQIKFFLFILSFVFFCHESFALGLDWESSYMKVEYSKEHTNVPSFSCFGYTDQSGIAGPCFEYAGPEENCVWENLDVLGFSDDSPSPEIDNCFQQAGNYKTTIQLYDFAQNPENPDVSTFVIFPGTPDKDQSVFTPSPNCANESLTANGNDLCNILFKVRDVFGNPVTQLKNFTGELYSDSEYINDANFGDLDFRNGLRLNNELIPYSESANYIDFLLSSNNEVQHQFTLLSWTPSTRLWGPYLGKNIPFELALNMTLPQILEDGTVDTNNLVTFAFDKYSPNVQFRPWARTLLQFVNLPPEFILETQTPMKILRNLVLPTIGGPNPLISTLLSIYNLPEHILATNVAIKPDDIAVTTQETVISPKLELDLTFGDISPVSNLAFSTDVQYEISDGGINKTIAYPSGAVGAGIPDGSGADDYDELTIMVTLIGASIEGNLLGDEEDTILQDTKTIRLGHVKLQDIRQEIFQNAFELSRGSDVKTDTSAIPFDVNWYSADSIVVVNNQDVIIGNTGSTLNLPVGKNTLVIQNGNLIIDGSFDYQNKLDSFGFILINEVVEPTPEKGNIFVRTDVKKMVGTYFAEGGLISNDSFLPSITNTCNDNICDGGNFSNDTQLLLEGTLLSRNTLGGSTLRTFESVYTTPWTTTSSQSNARIYDLHFVRQFRPIYLEEPPFTQTNTDNCSSNPCDDNRNAFIIRFDGRATKLSPPGFETSNIFSR